MSISQTNPITGSILAGLIAAYHDGTSHIGIEQSDLLSPTMTEAIRRDPSQSIRQINTNFTVPAKFFGVHTRTPSIMAELKAAGAGTFRTRDCQVLWMDCVAKILSATADPTTDTITVAGHGINPMTQWVYIYGTVPGGVTPRQLYHVVNPTTDTIQISTTDGGAPVNLTSAGSGLFMAVVNKSKIHPSRTGTLDLLIDQAAALSMDVIYDCSHPPASVTIDGTNKNRVNNSTHVTNYFKFLSDRYNRAITHYEAWNEPNDDRQFYGTIAGASNDLLLYTGYWYDAIQYFSTGEKVISPSFNTFAGVALMDAWLSTWGGNSKIHIFGIHPYRGGSVQLGYSNRVLDAYIAVAKAKSPGKEIWITEVGESYLDESVIQRAHMYAAVAGVARLCWYDYDFAAGLGDMRITSYPGLPEKYKAMMTACAGKTIRYVNECADRRIGVGVGATDTIY